MVKLVKCPDCGLALVYVGQTERFYRRSSDKDIQLTMERFGWNIAGEGKRHNRGDTPELGECSVLHIAVVREFFVPHDENRKFEGDS